MKLSLPFFVILIFYLTSAAYGQTIDYGGLEDLFGESVTTSATGKPQKAGDVPATMTIIPAEEIQRSGVRTLPEVLNRVLGVDVLQWGVSSSDVGVRGYNQAYNPRLLVLLNGRQVYLDHFGVTQWAAIPVQMNEIRQIEIVKGPQSALYGFNAVSGVINIITYSPMHDDDGGAQITLGTQGHKEVSAFKSFQVSDQLGMRVSAGGWDINEFDTEVFPFEEISNRNSTRKTAAFDSLFKASPDLTLGLEATWSDLKQTEMLVSNFYVSSDYEVRSLKGSWEFDTSFGQFDGTVYNNRVKIQVAGVLPEVELSQTNSVTVAKMQGLFNVGNAATLRVAGEYRHNKITVAPVAMADMTSDVYSISGSYDRKITETISLTLAGRRDKLDLQRNGTPAPPFFPDGSVDRRLSTWSYNGALNWQVTELDSIRATVAKGTQLPNLNEFGGFYFQSPIEGLPFPLVITGNPFLDPSCAINYEIAWDRSIPAIGGNARFSAFRQKSDNYRSIPTASNLIFTDGFLVNAFSNVGMSDALGFEAEVSGRFKDFGWRIGYSTIDIDDDLVRLQNGLKLIDFEDSASKHTVKVNLNWQSGALSADVLFVYGSPRSPLRTFDNGTFLPMPWDIGDTLSSHFSVGYALKDSVQLSLTASNAFSDENRLSVGREIERRVLFTTTWAF